jgi:predicted nucleic acid-binding protein
VILLDTSVLVAALTGTRSLAPALHRAVESGERLGIASIVLYEWRRGPRTAFEIATLDEMIPADAALPFGTAEALVAAALYRRLKRPRQREIDIAIAAVAMTHQAELWTANPADFADIPDLRLFDRA